MENDNISAITIKNNSNGFSFELLKNIISLSTSFAFLFGVIHSSIFFWWFKVPFIEYYNIADYFTTCIRPFSFGIAGILFIYILEFINYIKKLLPNNKVKHSDEKAKQEFNKSFRVFKKIILFFYLLSIGFLLFDIYLFFVYLKPFDAFFFFFVFCIIISSIIFLLYYNKKTKIYSTYIILKHLKYLKTFLIAFSFFSYFFLQTITEINEIEHQLFFHKYQIAYTLKEDNPKYKTAIILSISSDYVFLINPKREVFVLPKDSFKEFKVN
jgi:hypothetical protein